MNNNCYAFRNVVMYDETTIQNVDPLQCPYCEQALKVGGKVLRDKASKIEGFVKFGRGDHAGPFYQSDYLQIQVQKTEKRKFSENGSKIWQAPGMEVYDSQKVKAAFPGKLQLGCCMALSAVWLQYQGRFEPFFEHVMDAGDDGGLRRVKRYQLAYQFSDVQDHLTYIRSEVFGEMEEFAQSKKMAKADIKRGENITATSKVTEITGFANKPGHYFLGFWGNGGHAVAIVNHGKKASFFDPNYGQFDFPTMANLTQFLRMFTNHIYGDMTGKWEIARLTHQGYQSQGDQVAIKM